MRVTKVGCARTTQEPRARTQTRAAELFPRDAPTTRGELDNCASADFCYIPLHTTQEGTAG